MVQALKNKRVKKSKDVVSLKTQKTRLGITLCCMALCVFIFVFSSAMFNLKKVDFAFYNELNEKISFKETQIFNSTKKIEDLAKTANFSYGKSVFTIDKDKYLFRLEKLNPYIKIFKIENLFPNSFLIHAKERKPVCYFEDGNEKVFIDSEYKILCKSNQNPLDNAVPMKFFGEQNQEISFFNFFRISPLAIEEGQFLTENNYVFTQRKDFYNILNKNLQNEIENINFHQNSFSVNEKIKTKKEKLGIILEIEDVLQNYSQKLIKLQNAFYSLYKNEKIKTTYGRLFIDKNCNCFWYKM